MILVRRALGEVLRQHRNRQGRTLRDVADAARVSLGYLSEIERGQKEPSSELLFSVCDALNVPLSDVLAETGDHLRASEDEQGRTRPDAGAGTSSSDRVAVGGAKSPAGAPAAAPAPARPTATPSRPAVPPTSVPAARAAAGLTAARVSAAVPVAARITAPLRPLVTRKVVLARPASRPEPTSLGDLVTMPRTVSGQLRTEPIVLLADDVVDLEARELADALA